MFKQIHTLLDLLSTRDGQIQWDISLTSVTYIATNTHASMPYTNLVLHLLGVGIVPSGGYTVDWLKARLTQDTAAGHASLFFVPLTELPALEERVMLPDYIRYLQTLAIGSVYFYDPTDQTPPFAVNFSSEYSGGLSWINRMVELDKDSDLMWTWADETWRFNPLAKAGEGFAVAGFNTGIYWKEGDLKRSRHKYAWEQGQKRHPHFVKERQEEDRRAREDRNKRAWEDFDRRQKARNNREWWDEPYEDDASHDHDWGRWEDIFGKRRKQQEREEPRRSRRAAYTPFEACQVLGLQWGGGTPLDKKSVVSAYRQLAKKFHPDMLMSAPESERLAGEERFKEVSNAYQILCEAWNL